MQSSGSESASPTTYRVQSLSSADTRGKHRIQAELKRLEQEARFLEKLIHRQQRKSIHDHSFFLPPTQRSSTPIRRTHLSLLPLFKMKKNLRML